MSKHRNLKVRKTAHVVGFVWRVRTRTYNRPVLSGGVSACVHCTALRSAVKPHESCKPSPEGKHIFATEVVTKGWSNGR